MDIVEGLRSRLPLGDGSMWSKPSLEIREAADEITKLRAELAEANQTIEEQIKVRHAWEIHSALLEKQLAEAKKAMEFNYEQYQDAARLLCEVQDATELSLSLLKEVHLINDTYKRIRSERILAADDFEYDLFSWGWKAAVDVMKEQLNDSA